MSLFDYDILYNICDILGIDMYMCVYIGILDKYLWHMHVIVYAQYLCVYLNMIMIN